MRCRPRHVQERQKAAEREIGPVVFCITFDGHLEPQGHPTQMRYPSITAALEVYEGYGHTVEILGERYGWQVYRFTCGRLQFYRGFRVASCAYPESAVKAAV